jgi:hypothetical protein
MGVLLLFIIILFIGAGAKSPLGLRSINEPEQPDSPERSLKDNPCCYVSTPGHRPPNHKSRSMGYATMREGASVS